jgi:hypothetical protein
MMGVSGTKGRLVRNHIVEKGEPKWFLLKQNKINLSGYNDEKYLIYVAR